MAGKQRASATGRAEHRNPSGLRPNSVVAASSFPRQASTSPCSYPGGRCRQHCRRAETHILHTKETLGFRVYFPSDLENDVRPRRPRGLQARSRPVGCYCSHEPVDPRNFLPNRGRIEPQRTERMGGGSGVLAFFTKVAVELYLGMSQDEEREVFLGLLEDDAPRRRRVRII